MLRIFAPLFIALGLTLPLAACAEEGHAPYAAGTHYQVLDNPVPVADPSKVEVREFFSYTCPHCFETEPLVTEWKKTIGDDVHFVQTHVTFLRNAESLARAFYIAQAKGMLDKTHQPLFDAIHKHREPLFTVPALANFYKKYGLDPKEFNELYSSFGISTKVRQADALSRDYGITGVPSFTVNGKYQILRSNLKNNLETFKVIDYLVAKERKALGK